MQPPSKSQLRKLIAVGNYQFGRGVGSTLFRRNVAIKCSRRTGRIRHVYIRGRLVATLRPKDGFLALTPDGADIILSKITPAPNVVVANADVAEAIKEGGDVFAKHVRSADLGLRPGEEVIVTDPNGTLLGVGSAVLAGQEMTSFTRGVAVNLRKGLNDQSSHNSPSA